MPANRPAPRLEIKREGNTYYFDGILNEKADLSSIDIDSREHIIFDLKEVKAANSIGILNFINMIKDAKFKTFTYRCVPFDFLTQIDMIPGLLGDSRGKIESAYLAFCCDRCEFETFEIIPIKDLKAGDNSDLAKACSCEPSGCLEPSEFLDFEFLQD